jgi:di/tripeptidase
MFNQLIKTFFDICQIDSPTGEEKKKWLILSLIILKI